MVSHTNERPHVCNFSNCHYMAHTKRNLIVHMRIHTGERPYKCDYPNCGYSCTTNSYLKIHTLNHTGDKPYKCTESGCGYSTIYKCSLIKHKNIHMCKPIRENPFSYSCIFEECEFITNDKGTMRMHMRINH
jgi:uncharacterized Zn-finger protein